MIWVSEDVPIECPENCSVTLIGEYNEQPNPKPMILLELVVVGPDSSWNLEVFQKTPSMMRRESPEPGDILHKYNHKVAKAFEKYKKYTWTELQSLNK